MSDDDLSGLPPAQPEDERQIHVADTMWVGSMQLSGHDVVVQCPCARCREVRPFVGEE